MPLIPSYEDLFVWRSICEYLAPRWYKTEEAEELIALFPNAEILTGVGRATRRALWDQWGLQLFSYGDHPVLNFRHVRGYNSYRGWTLKQGWEFKIDFLERVVLFGEEPDAIAKTWHRHINFDAIAERQRRDRERLVDKITLYQERFENGLCWNCAKPMIHLMLDCPHCKADYEKHLIAIE